MSRRNAISDDDGRKDAARLLLNQPLVRASTDPEAHRLIRRHKDALAQSFRNHLGYRLVVEPHFTELVERYDPPHGRAAMTGMSGGARMSCRFAAANSHMVSMVGAVGGVRARPSTQHARCQYSPSTAVRIASTLTGAAGRAVGWRASPTLYAPGGRPTATLAHRASSRSAQPSPGPPSASRAAPAR